ncbi:MAG: acyl-CoA thioesterase [Aquabacterium sp.]|nr:acyl-CoA thioesterase [Aquabacterium sp.]
MSLYLRLIWVFVRALFRSKLQMSDTIELKLCVLPNDLDANLHMNNGRFMTVLDLGIVEAVVRSGFFRTIRSMGGALMAGGVLMTFRRQLKPFARYTLRMRYLGCDPYWHVFEFVFIHPNGTAAAKGLVKGTGVRKRHGIITTPLMWAQYAKLFGEEPRPPELPDYAVRWLALEAEIFATQHQNWPASPL